MMVAQHLYESGRITYMRTDSVNLSGLCINASKEEIKKVYGEEYSKPRQYHTSSKGAQEAHEAIRPTYMDVTEIEGTLQERRLYELIWKRTIASQMADAELEKTTVDIKLGNQQPTFVAQGEVVKFDGFLKVYRESFDDEDAHDEENSHLLPPLKKGQVL
jgi:DNA topoisomerase-1